MIFEFLLELIKFWTIQNPVHGLLKKTEIAFLGIKAGGNLSRPRAVAPGYEILKVSLGVIISATFKNLVFNYFLNIVREVNKAATYAIEFKKERLRASSCLSMFLSMYMLIRHHCRIDKYARSKNASRQI